jgi:hypothetical protein
MRPLAVDLVLLRATAPDLPLVVGRVLAARVVERHGRHGIVNLAGAFLTAELPDEVEVGDKLRLVVQEARGEQVVLALAQEPPPPLAEAALPPDDRVVVLDGEGDGRDDDAERAQVVALRFRGDALGAVELRVSLGDGLVHVRAALAGGPPLVLARERAGALRDALAAVAGGRAAEVEVVRRPDPVDVYA